MKRLDIMAYKSTIYSQLNYVRGTCIFILSGQEASRLGLESNDDHSDLQISLLLQLGEHSCAEEDLTLSDPVQVGV